MITAVSFLPVASVTGSRMHFAYTNETKKLFTLSQLQRKNPDVCLHHVNSTKSIRYRIAFSICDFNKPFYFVKIERYFLSKYYFINVSMFTYSHSVRIFRERKRISSLRAKCTLIFSYCFSCAHMSDVHTDVVFAGRRVECRHWLDIDPASPCLKEMSSQTPSRGQLARQRKDGHRQRSFYRSFS